MDDMNRTYLTKKQAIEKYPFLTDSMLKNILYKNIDGFRVKVVKKIGRRILLDERAFLDFIDKSVDYPIKKA